MMTKKKHKIIIADKSRFIFFVVLVLTIVAITAVAFFSAGSVKGRNESDFMEVHIVKGDTLWDIAVTYNPGRKDIRKLVFDIMKANNMDSSVVFEGQVIKVPTY